MPLQTRLRLTVDASVLFPDRLRAMSAGKKGIDLTMRLLLATTCLTSLAALAPAAQAQTSVDTKRTTQVRTSTVKSGAADDVRITATGTVQPVGGAAVVLDSANKVANEGTIQVTNADGSAGVVAVGGGSGTITNAASGKIIIDETYEPTDLDKDGDLDGPFASGRDRFGIQTLGAFTGTVVNNGAITVEGNDSAGIALGGKLTGALATDGIVAVTGDRSIGVRTGDVTGPVRLAGTVTARGKDAVGALIGGVLSGSLVVQGAITATGYRYTAAPADVSKLDADDLLQGGPALAIAGNVAGGVILAVPPKDANPADNDEDKDGIEDAKEGSAAVTSYSSAAAVQVGAGNRDVTLGPVAGTGSGHGLVIDGAASGIGVYSGVNATGILIGGQGGRVSLSSGMTVNGSVSATAVNANATAIRIGAAASVPEIRMGGTVAASGGGASGQQAVAIQVDQGGSVATVRNSGTMKATAAGAAGAATAILDKAGTVTLVENAGAISATGAATASDRNVAIDLRANGAGASVRQIAVASGVAAPSITGDVLFGSGADTLDLADGSYAGLASFGAGSNRLALSGDATFSGKALFGAGNDVMTLAGTSMFTGAADFGGGADTLTIGGTALFQGTLTNAGALAVRVDGGRFEVTGTGPTAVGSLAVGANGTLGVTLDTATGAATRYDVAGTASFEKGAKVAVRLTGVANAEGQFTIVRAGALTGAANITANDLLLPFLYKSTLVTPLANELAVSIKRKTAAELGLNRSGASAYDAIYAALGKDQKVAGAVLDIRDGAKFRRTVQSMLPEHAGGVFEAVTAGSRATARFLSDGGAPFKDQGRWAYRLESVGWGRSKGVGDTASYDLTGLGFSGGAEIKSGLGRFGASLGYLHGQVDDGQVDNEVLTDSYELALYWRVAGRQLQPYARVSAAKVDLTGQRRFEGVAPTADGKGEALSRVSSAKWGAGLLSATAGLSYDGGVGVLTLRPRAQVDYYRLNEDGYTEAGGGAALDLRVDRRTSDELSGEAALALGLGFGATETGWFHAEVEGGRRQILSGGLGATTARFGAGQAFTLTPEERTSGWLARVRGVGGAEGFRLAGELSGEQQQGRAALAMRVTLQVGL